MKKIKRTTLKKEVAWVAVWKRNPKSERSLTDGYWIGRKRKDIVDTIRVLCGTVEDWVPVRVTITPAKAKKGKSK